MGVWPTGGGYDRDGEGIVIGFVDSGIYPHHPSFATHNTAPYGPLPKYRGKCEIDPNTKRDFCNGKIIGAQHFAAAAVASGAFNPSVNYASPLDGDGHGSHTAAIAAGNNGILLRMHGFEFGRACGMAPRARLVFEVLQQSYFKKFQLETLFYIFYSMPRDEAQLYASNELYVSSCKFMHVALSFIFYAERIYSMYIYGLPSVIYRREDVTCEEVVREDVTCDHHHLFGLYHKLRLIIPLGVEIFIL